MASAAGRIMAMAKRRGGPVSAYAAELRAAFAETGGGDAAVLAKIRRVMKPYFDDAESLAASVLTQREQDK